jgi:hypothetical protein
MVRTAIPRILGIFSIFTPTLTHAQNAPNLDQLEVPVVAGNNLIAVLTNLVDDALVWLGVVAFVFVAYGGFLYSTAGGDPARAEKGRNTIMYAVIGIFIIFVSYALVRYVIGVTNNSNSQTNSNTSTNQRFIGPPAPEQLPNNSSNDSTDTDVPAGLQQNEPPTCTATQC